MRVHLVKGEENVNITEVISLFNCCQTKEDFMFSEGKVNDEKIKRILNSKQIDLFILEQDKRYLGFCTVVVRKDVEEIKSVAKIQSITILPEYRKKGYGSKLLKKVLANLKKDKIGTVYLEVIGANTGALNMYTNLGFEKTGEIKNYFSREDNQYPLFIMSKYI